MREWTHKQEYFRWLRDMQAINGARIVVFNQSSPGQNGLVWVWSKVNGYGKFDVGLGITRTHVHVATKKGLQNKFKS